MTGYFKLNMKLQTALDASSFTTGMKFTGPAQYKSIFMESFASGTDVIWWR